MGTQHYQPIGIHTANMPTSSRDIAAATADKRFITIARQIGADCFALPGLLKEQLNSRNPVRAWSQWDQELIEKVSRDHQIPRELIASMESSGYSWVDDLLSGVAGRVDEMIVFSRVKAVVRELAGDGHVILIGHGSTYMTRDLPGGLNIRLIAPTEYRIKRVAERFKLSENEASRHMRRIDKRRERFFGRFWPDLPLSAEMFAATFNAADGPEPVLASAILAMLGQTS